jgi:hypothetical protein
MFEVEKGVARKQLGIYPFGQMEVDDSFLVPSSSKDDRRRTQRHISAVSTSHGRRNGKRFSTRQVEGGVRCWRIA